MKEEVIKDAWMEYTADMLALIARPNYKTQITMFSEIVQKARATNKKQMTAAEIKEHVLKRLLE